MRTKLLEILLLVIFFNLVESFARSRRAGTLPQDAHKIIVHNMRHFDVYGSSNGAYIVQHGTSTVTRIGNVPGNVVHGIIADKFFRQNYNIYLTVKVSACRNAFYALRDGEVSANKINGLPDNAQLLSIHNLAGVIFFGSMNGAFELTQGDIQAVKVPGTSGNVVKIKLGGSAGKYDAEFIRGVSKCHLDESNTKLEKLQNDLKQNSNKLKDLEGQIVALTKKLEEKEKKMKKEKADHARAIEALRAKLEGNEKKLKDEIEKLRTGCMERTTTPDSIDIRLGDDINFD